MAIIKSDIGKMAVALYDALNKKSGGDVSRLTAVEIRVVNGLTALIEQEKS